MSRQLTFQELKVSNFYFRWVKADYASNVIEVSVERQELTNEFEGYLKEHGYKKVEGREDHYTDYFVYEGG